MRINAFVLFLVVPIVGAGFAAACKVSEPDSSDSADDDAGDPSSLPATSDTSNPTSTDAGGATAPSGTGLPCDVQGVLENRCLACHGGPGTDPPQLRTYDNLMAKSTKDPTKTRAELCVELMTQKAMPPTPAVPPEADEIATFADWVEAGAPKNPTYCNATDLQDAGPTPIGDGGGGGLDGGVDASVCTSGTHWTQGDHGDQKMHPGAACNACHQVKGGPNLRVAGTIFPSLHEETDCNGSAPPPTLTVTVTDSKNKSVKMVANSAGNFIDQGTTLKPPLKATISDGTKTRSMTGSVTSGDCNSCHQATGLNGAPGRIMAP